MKLLALSDIHSKKSALQSILSSIDRRGIEAIILAGDLTSHGSKEEALELLEMLSFAKLFVVPGNLDSWNALKAMQELGVSLHCRKEEFNGIVFSGMGGGLIGGIGEILFSEQEIEKKLLPLVEENSVLVTHLPPKNSSLDLAGENNIGSNAVREIIEGKKPGIHICGHAHDSRNTEWINETLCINPGPVKEGCAAFIEAGKEAKVELI